MATTMPTNENTERSCATVGYTRPPPRYASRMESRLDRILLMVCLDTLDRGARLDPDLPPLDGDREHVHRARRGPLNDLPVAVVLRAVARAVELPLGFDGIQRGRVGHPGYGAAQVRALPPQGQKPLGDARQVELALVDALDVAHLVVVDVASRDHPTKCADLLGPEEADELHPPLRQQRQDHPPEPPAQHQPTGDAGARPRYRRPDGDSRIADAGRRSLSRGEQPLLDGVHAHLLLRIAHPCIQSMRSKRGSPNQYRCIPWPRKKVPEIVSST